MGVLVRKTRLKFLMRGALAAGGPEGREAQLSPLEIGPAPQERFIDGKAKTPK